MSIYLRITTNFRQVGAPFLPRYLYRHAKSL